MVNEVEFVGEVKYAESVYIGCVYTPTDGPGIATIGDRYNLLEEDVLTFKQKGKVVLLRKVQ